MATSAQEECRRHNLEFSNVTLEVPASNGRRHTLLYGVSGYCSSQHLTAIMGPTGSGKTTLLDVLSGVRFKGRLSGALRIGGISHAAWVDMHTMAYVMQQDVLPLLDTPREAITTSALLRLPPSLPLQAKLKRVEYLLELLDLQDCADLVMGDNTQGVRGISGGQRRRVTIAIELVKNPSLVFLDEPLTGLDSEMAGTVAACLSRLARVEGKTVVMSLHQASRRLYQHVDGLILMAAGDLVYCGPFDGAQPYLQSLGHSQLPEQTAEEFIITVLRGWTAAGTSDAPHSQITIHVDGGDAPAPVKEGAARGTGRGSREPPPGIQAARSGRAHPSQGAVQEGEAGWPSHQAYSLASPPVGGWLLARFTLWGGSGGAGGTKRPASPLRQQLRVLLARNFRWLRRDWPGTLAFLASSLVTGLLAGFIFFNLSSTVPAAVQDRLGLLWLVLTSLLFSYNLTAIAGWEQCRQLLRREHSTRLYGITAYFVAHCTVWAAYIVLAVALLSVLYFIAQLQLVAGKFFVFYAVLLLMAYAADLMGFLMAVLAPDNTTAVALQAAVALLLVASSGFLAKTVPVYLRWLQQSSFVTFAYTSLALNEFSGLVVWDGAGADAVPVQGLEALRGTGVVHASWGLGANVAVLGGITGVLCGAAYLSLGLVAKLQRF